MNWNILLTLGKEIKRDSKISVSENREALTSKMVYKLFELNGEPSSKAKYDV